MHYKLYSYELDDRRERVIAPDRHYALFQNSVGRDDSGRLAKYYGKADTVLMHVRKYRSDFTGLVGRHSTIREVTEYVEESDETQSRSVGDDNYPNAAFICMPRLRMIACVDSSEIKADSAMSRLHQILAHRQGVSFVFSALRETFDLRNAVHRFRVVEVTYDIRPVNPHTGDIGRALDESRKRDHIRKLQGKIEGKASDPLRLDGGFLTAVQQLQQSGHAKVGFTALTDKNVEIKVPKPRETGPLADDELSERGSVDVRISLPNTRLLYPFTQAHVTDIRTIAKQLTAVEDEE